MRILVITESNWVHIGLAGAWECLIAYDSLLFGLVISKIVRDRGRGTPGIVGLNSTPSLQSLIIRDGKRII